MSQELKNRTKKFAIDVILFVESIENKDSSRIIKRQLIRSASSVGANYRAACRAKSDKDYIHKLKICEEESDESNYWLELIEAFNFGSNGEKLQILKQESSELTAIIVSSIKKVKSRVYN